MSGVGASSAAQGSAKPVSKVPYDTIFSTVYAGLRINLCLLAAVSPLLVVLAFTSEPLAAWPFFAALSVLCGPAAAGAFAAFEAMGVDPARVGRAFWSGYRAGFARALGVSGAAAALVVVVGVDLQQAVGTRFSAVTPLLAVLLVVVVTVTTTMLAAGWRLSGRSVLAAAYLSLRKWYLALADLVVLGVLLAAVVSQPALGLFLLPAPALYVVWANTRHLLSTSPTAQPTEGMNQ
ncbi:MAG: hypothetical protein JF587_23080 [Catenulisporales bacterium]|nr:hypothetical protein [Catenulisporales bacterium]